jgi:hypothetical protein
MGVVWTGLIWLRIWTSGGLLHGNGPSGSIKCWEVLEQLHTWWFLNKGLVP